MARSLSLSFIDTDSVLLRKLGMPISAFFQQYGEKAFRREESTVLEGVCRLDEQLIATGGGIVLSDENRRLLRSKAWVVFLKCDAQNIFQRIGRDHRRPLLNVEDKLKALTDLISAREPMYAEVAHETLQCSGVPAHEIVREIIGRYEAIIGRG